MGLGQAGLIMGVQIVMPARQHLASYVAALQRGWSPDNRIDLRPRS